MSNMQNMINDAAAMWRNNHKYIDTFYLCNKYGETFDRAHTVVDFAVIPVRITEYVAPLSPIIIEGKSVILFINRVGRENSLSLFTPLLKEQDGITKLYRLLHVFGDRIYYETSLSPNYDLTIYDYLLECSSQKFCDYIQSVLVKQKRILFPHIKNYARILGKNIHL